MSADAWSLCPRCVYLAKKDDLANEQELIYAYGRVPLDQWTRMRDSRASKASSLEESLREDFEIGFDGERFFVSYGASCKVCGFTHEFTAEQDLAAKVRGES